MAVHSESVVNLSIGALLHDIGKFRQRAHPNPSDKRHTQWGAEWLEDVMGQASGISMYLASHHEGDEDVRGEQGIPHLMVVCEGDSIAAAERPEKAEGEEINRWHRHVPLQCVFSKVFRQEGSTTPWRYFPLAEVGSALRRALPLDEVAVDQGSYQHLWSLFDKDFRHWAEHSPTNVPGLMYLLERYCSCIPSETQVVEAGEAGPVHEKMPDISLFDHCRATAAVAAAMLRYFEDTAPEVLRRRGDAAWVRIRERSEQRYLLVAGDLSGIQSFVYTVGSRGALKSLRGRSAYLELMMQVLALEVLQVLGLTATNIVYLGGGGFQILGQNTAPARAGLTEVRRKWNRWALEQFQGRLAIALEWAECTGDELAGRGRSYSGVVSELRELVRVSKHAKFREDLNTLLAQEPEGQRECAICLRQGSEAEITELTEEEGAPLACPECHAFLELGRVLHETRTLKQVQPEVARGRSDCLRMGDYYYRFGKSAPDDHGPTLLINPSSIHDFRPDTQGAILVANYTSKEPHGGVADFQTLAARATGDNLIGSLRADVDHMGQMFAEGLEPKDRTFSRISVLSRQLNRFFKLHLNEICAGRLGDCGAQARLVESPSAPRYVSVVYSGGDDLFIVGAWSEVAELAFDLQRCFRAFVGENPSITLSAGVVVADEHLPLVQMAAQAGDAEKAAKDNGRNSLALFYSSLPHIMPQNHRDGGNSVRPWSLFTWPEAEELFGRTARLAELLQGRVEQTNGGPRLALGVSTGFLRHLATVADFWQTKGQLSLPLLAYAISSYTFREDNDDKRVQERRDELKRLLHDPEKMHFLYASVFWLIRLSRATERGR